MWTNAVTFVTVSCLVSSVVCLAVDLEDNVVPEESLQDLTLRTKKSPAGEDTEKKPGNLSKSDAELTAVLTEDIKRKIEDLKELKNAYHKVESDFFGPEGSQSLKSSIESSSSELLAPDAKNPLQGSLADSNDGTVRTARQYFPSSYPDNQYTYQKYIDQKGMFPQSSYSNGKYQSVSSHSSDSFADRDAPYIAQYNPSARTFGALDLSTLFPAGLELPKIPDLVKPEVLPAHTPAITIKPVEHEHPAAPEHAAPPAVNVVLPPSLPAVTVSEHKPSEASTSAHSTTHDTKVPLYYEKKEIGTPGSFFSKQVIYGPSKEFGEGGSYSSYESYPYGSASLQPSYPQGYASGGSPSYWYAADRNGYFSPAYVSSPDAQSSYSYGPAYSPGYPYQAYYPAGGNLRSHRDLTSQFQMYQDELDSVLSQFFSAGTTAARFSPFGRRSSSADQLKEDIELEQKKIQTLQEQINSPPQSGNGGPGISQSFLNWLSKEVDVVYSKWTQLKDDLTKTKQDSDVAANKDVKPEEIKV